jgi:hypothetical protein
LVHDLVDNNSIPVYWAINDQKAQDGVDFAVDGINFSGGPFIIPAEFAAAAQPIVNAWVAKGVVVHTATVAFIAPANGAAEVLTYVPFAVGTDPIITTLFYDDAEIPDIRLTTRPFQDQNADKGGTAGLGMCEDIVAMPHEDPDGWPAIEANRLACLVDQDGSESGVACNNIWSDGAGGSYTRNQGGHFWAACHSVSAVEATVASGFLGLNFLSNTALIDYNSHAEQTAPPYTYPSSQVPAVGNINASRVMQFIGRLDGALTGGSEDIYLPDANGWRDTTTIGVYDPDHPQVPKGEAALVAFGNAYGVADNGFVVYETSHNLNSGSVAENVAAARVYGNFLMEAGIRTKLIVDAVSVPGNMAVGTDAQLDITTSGGSGSYTYLWTDTCGGSFSDATIRNPVYTPPSVTTLCTITVAVEDICGRKTFSANGVSITNDNLTLSKSGPAQACPGDTIDYVLLPGVVDGTLPLSNLCVFDDAPAGTSSFLGSPAQTAPGEWCLGSTTAATDGVDPGNPASVASVVDYTWALDEDTYVEITPGKGGDVFDNHYGGNNDLWVEQGLAGYFSGTLLQFTPPAGINAAISGGGTVTSATLSLFSEGGDGNGGVANVHRMDTDWVEGTSDANGATWEDPNGLGVAGDWATGQFSTSDYNSGVVLGTINGSVSNVVASASDGGLITQAQDWLSGADNNFGFGLASTTADDSSKFESVEGTGGKGGSGLPPNFVTTVTTLGDGIDPASTVSMSAAPTLVVTSGVVTVSMDVSLQHYTGDTTVTPPAGGSLLSNITGSVTDGGCTGPSPASAVFVAANSALGQTQSFSYTCTVSAPASVGNAISWSTPAIAQSPPTTAGSGFSVAGDTGVTFNQATSSSVVVTPELGFSVVVTATAPGTVSNTATIDDDVQQLQTSNTVDTDLPDAFCNAPDLTPVITLTPNVMVGITDFEVLVQIIELLDSDTSGTITVRIPKDSRLSVTAWDPNGTSLPTSGNLVNNAIWTFTEDATTMFFTTDASIAGATQSNFGFSAQWSAGQTVGFYTASVVIVPGSGAEIRTNNNTDAEKASYSFQ